ncbi:CRISPR-associated protein, Csh2 family [Aminomonas paucivorans DSM 12260]|uniref:CRISPR-associated protein, Csh2 family n=1 Tax=Aminomonas paucivorans DSM 12260 TaxID=584708 RepID=E3CYI1_9BACT|nr:type I-B CRISPR-associated protein Cas7/Csh2 [Aminomonas paucivorans]EFQ22712.1 CRISPR-associated protein, Csh2 family [Aminomonas paucivorans DSM 12260]
MAFTGRRELYFAYTVKDANPNGDPLNANHPRYDEDTEQILVSDVRVKRTVRDQWIREGKIVFVDGEKNTLKERVEALRMTFNSPQGKDLLEQCIDTRLFGVTFALGKEAFSWTGPVQFKWGRSLHRAKVEMAQGTAAFATKEESAQRSFRNEYRVPFCLLGVYGIANQYPSRETGATEEDLNALTEGLWKGTANLITRSKMEHRPRLLLEIRYRDGFDGAIGSLDEKVRLVHRQGGLLSEDEQRNLRSLDGLALDMGEIGKRLESLNSQVASVKVLRDDAIALTGWDGTDTLKERYTEETR